MSNYIAPSVSVHALEQLIQNLRLGSTQLHCIKLYRGDELLLRYALSPYRCDDRREVYSLSKIFTSTACGLCYDRGLLHPDGRVVDWFPEYRELWEKDERFGRMKIRHLLTMSDGHDHCTMHEMADAESSVQAYFEVPLCYEPGTHFTYSTGATCMAAEIVRRASGKNVPELLSEKLLPTLGIEPFFYECCADGHCVGGSGFNLSCDDVAQLGRLYLGHGVYEGERLLSDEWVDMATAALMDNSNSLTQDWCAGYGFQFWQCAAGAFRGDGAFGQLCIMLPQKNLQLTLFAECINSMQAEMDAVYAFLHTFEKKTGQPALLTESYTAQHSWYPCGCGEAPLLPDSDTGERIMQENPMEIKTVRVIKWGNQVEVMLTLQDGTAQTLLANTDKWTDGELHLKNYKPVLRELLSRQSKQVIRYSARLYPDWVATVIEMRLRNAPHTVQMRIWEQQGKLILSSLSAAGLMNEKEKLVEK